MAALHQRAPRAPEITTEDMFIMVISEARPWAGSCLPTWRGRGWQKGWQAREETGSAGCEAGALRYHSLKSVVLVQGKGGVLSRKAKDPLNGENLRGKHWHGGRRDSGALCRKYSWGAKVGSGQRGHCEEKLSRGENEY